MALGNFRLSEDQGDNSFVVVLGDDGKIRVVTRIAREAIDDYFQLRESTQRHRVTLVQSNLPSIARVIERKYLAGDQTTYSDSLGIADERNRLIVVGYHDLHRGERLSDAILKMEGNRLQSMPTGTILAL